MSDDPFKLEPPGFPYPGEEIIYSSARNAPNFQSGEDSWFCISKPDEEKVHTFGETTHRNPYRLTIHTPLRGSVSFFINDTDARCLTQGMLSLLADVEFDGREQAGEHEVNLDWYDDLTSDDYDIQPSPPDEITDLRDRLEQVKSEDLDGLIHPVYEYCVECDEIYIVREDEHPPESCFDHTTISDTADGVTAWIRCIEYIMSHMTENNNE